MIQIQVIKLSRPLIYLTYPQGGCLFNVPEGFQRYSADYGFTLKQGLKIFLTQCTPQHCNGFIGLLLTLNQEKLIADSILFGPRGLCDLVECARNNEIGGLNLYQMRVFEYGGRKLNVWDENENDAIQKQIQMDFEYYKDQFVEVEHIVYQQKIISYLVKICKQRGKIQKEQLKQLKLSNIEQAILFQKGELKKDDRLIYSHELREPDVPEQLILILDIIDDAQLDLFDMNLQYLSVYHINTPTTEKYLQFIDQLKCDHIFCNSEQENQYSPYIPKSKYICNVLHTQYPNNFPQIVQHFSEQQQQHFNIQTFHTYIIHPVHKRGYQQLLQVPQQSEIRKYEFPYNPKQYNSKVRITFLGTASMKPNKYRNVSSILIDNDGQPILLDCGEGTLRQLQDESFKNQNPILIYISHIHSDHNLGLGCLMAEYDNLCLLLPSSMIPWVVTLRRVYGLTNPYTIIPINPELVEQDFIKAKLQYPKDLPIISLKDIKFKCKITMVPVIHCPQAYGIRLDFDEGTSLTYSGDTRPCQSFMELSLNADIMIHEATFTDDSIDKAKKTNHSTAKEAVLLGMQANCKCVILTHFSQRFTKCSSIPNMEEDYLKTRTAMAIDHLSGQLDEFIDLVPLSQELQNE